MKHLFFTFSLLISVAVDATAQTATATAATAPAEPEAGSNLLVMGAFALFACLGIVMAIVALVQIKKLKEEKDNEITALKTALKQRNDDTDRQFSQMEAQMAQMEQRINRPAPQPTPRPAPQRSSAPQSRPKPQPVSFFLSRPAANGTFTSVSTHLEPGNSIFRLSTEDGANGTFEVIPDPAVHQLALMMPTENLTRACTGHNIQISAGKTSIITDTPGHAKKEGNLWKIVKPAVIHYE